MLKKSILSLLILFVGLVTAACNSSRKAAEPPSPTLFLPTTTTFVEDSPIVASATLTRRPSSATHTPTQAPTQTLTPTPLPPTLAPTASQDPFVDRLLPDLQTLPPTDLRLLYDPDSGRALIRFSNSIWNSGPGKLELIGSPNQAKDQIRVSQRIFGIDDETFDEFEIGEFIFHDQHHHWHLERFAVYEVWSVDENGALNERVSEGRKVSYCVLDTSQVGSESFDGIVSERQQYTHCEGDIQGLSVGWVDTYEDHLPGQWVEITPLVDGFYALVSTVNPDQIIFEANLDNNTAMQYFEIQDLRFTILEEGTFNGGND